ncbi:PAS domain-containing protein [uncultured Nitrospira sp.]|uniref:hybrid sensor histidine kinase/response regulator n=1 Tax=uncultured Nitrospira sp. TaxID=157176 RepID=UPI0031402C4E
MNSFSRNEDSVFDHVPLVVYRCTQRGIDRKFEFVTPFVHSLLDLTPEQLTQDSKAFFSRIHPEDRNMCLRGWENHTHLPVTIRLEYRMFGEGNRVVWVQENSVVSAGSLENEMVCHGVLIEIPNHQQIKEELHRWDRELQSLTSNLPDIIGRFDRKNRVMYLNRWWDSVDPFPPEKYLGKQLIELGVSKKVADIFEEKIQSVWSKGISESLEISHPTGQGLKNFEIRFCPEPTIGGQILTVLLICRDVTNVRMAELAFRDSDEKFRQLAETVDSVFWIWEVDLQQIVYVSPAYKRLWGGDPQKLMNNPFDWLTIVFQEDQSKVENLFLKRIDAKGLDIEYRIVTRHHELRWVHNRTFPVKDASGMIHRVIGIAQDVTERKKWEEERLRGAKLESLGLLAGGLAHDFNNLLTAILGQLSLAKFTLDSSSPLFNRISEAEHASLRAQDIARQLLTFSKGGAPVKKTVLLQEIIKENVQLVLSGSNVRPIFNVADDLWPVTIDAGQICQVIHNLVINARQAMEDGGECIIQAHNVKGDMVEHSDFGQMTLHAQDWVEIRFKDKGVGISKENLEKIFDPYFTTKSTGSGLGLATSYSIVRNHGGVLTVNSALGEGSTFSLFLPAIPIQEMAYEVQERRVKMGHGKILIMDDEIQIRKVLGEMVETCGYSYETAKDGEEALRNFFEAWEVGSPFSAVILDLTVPGGLGGKEVLSRLLTIDPQVKAIVVSGYSNDPVLANYQEYGFKGRVAKPFNLVDLSVVLQSVLE